MSIPCLPRPCLSRICHCFSTTYFSIACFSRTCFSKTKTLIHYGPFWSSLVKFDQVWSSLIQYDQIFCHHVFQHVLSACFVKILQTWKSNNNIAMYRTAIACARSQKELTAWLYHKDFGGYYSCWIAHQKWLELVSWVKAVSPFDAVTFYAQYILEH